MSDVAYAPAAPPARQQREDRWHLVAAGASLLFGYLCLRWGPLLAAEAAAGAALLLLCIARPFTGLLTTLGLTLALEQIGISTNGVIELDPWTERLHFFANLNSLGRLPWVYLNFMEVMLLTCGLSWAVRRAKAGTLRWRGGPLLFPLALLAGALVLAILYGLAAGASWKLALWETRALFQLMVTYLLAIHMIEERAQVRALVWTAIAAIFYRAIMAWYHAGVFLRFDLSGVDSVTTHEDGLFFASLLLFWAVLQLFRAEPDQRRVLTLLFPLLVGAFLFSKRRAAMVALLAAVPYLILLLDWPRARRALLVCAALAIPAGLYTAAFWNSDRGVAMPVQLIKSVIIRPQSGRMYYSNRYRDLENSLLAARIRQSPLLGIGFGKPFVAAGAALPDEGDRDAASSGLPVLDAPLSHYIPHNQILWVWAKAGFLGFAAFWFFALFAVAHGTRLARALQTPYLRAVAAFVALMVCMQLIVSFGDQQLTEYRNMVFLGLLLGTLCRLPHLDKQAVGRE